jgi:hypothetical protein
MDDQSSRAYDFFRKNGFVPVNADSYSVFKEYEGCTVLQEMSATIIVSWAFKFNSLYKIQHGYLCSVYFYDGKPVYFTIYQPKEESEYSLQQIIDILYDLSMEAGLPFLQVKFIENRFLSDFEGIKGYRVKTEHSDDDNEYAFKTKDLIELSGGVNVNKRKRIKKFLDNGRITLHSMTNENIHICFEIEKDWCKDRDCAVCESFTGCEKKALEKMGDIFDDSIYKGLIGYYDDVPVGYIFGETRNKNLSYLYFGKANVKDYFVYLIYMMVKTYLTNVEYMNMNEDMGNMGLRTFKQHLGAHELWRKNICTFTKDVGEGL